MFGIATEEDIIASIDERDLINALVFMRDSINGSAAGAFSALRVDQRMNDDDLTALADRLDDAIKAVQA